eukprot:913920-Amphidinium_carterae.1
MGEATYSNYGVLSASASSNPKSGRLMGFPTIFCQLAARLDEVASWSKLWHIAVQSAEAEANFGSKEPAHSSSLNLPLPEALRAVPPCLPQCVPATPPHGLAHLDLHGGTRQFQSCGQRHGWAIRVIGASPQDRAESYVLRYSVNFPDSVILHQLRTIGGFIGARWAEHLR